MSRIIVGIFIGVAVVAMAQDRVTVTAPKPSAVVPRWNKGVIEGRTYRNASVGLEITPAPGLEFEAPELSGKPGTVPLLVTISALGEAKLFSVQEAMSFYTDALAYYPETRRSTDAYVRRVIQGNKQGGRF